MRLAWLLAVAGAALPSGLAFAHGRELDWHVPPSDSLLVVLPLAAGTALYLRGMVRRGAGRGLHGGDAWRAASFTLAIVLLAAALVWPMDAWSALSFTGHMGQHMVLVALAPPLLLLGRPGAVCLHGLPAGWRAAATRPRRWPGAQAMRRLGNSVGATATLHGLLLWGWHMPALFELALRNELLHWLEHVTLLGSAVLFWRALLHARGTAIGWGVLSMLVTVIHSGMLGALLALAPRPLYGVYAGVADPLADQQLAGLLMWVPMGTVYLVAAVAFSARLVRGGERQLALGDR